MAPWPFEVYLRFIAPHMSMYTGPDGLKQGAMPGTKE